MGKPPLLAQRTREKWGTRREFKIPSLRKPFEFKELKDLLQEVKSASNGLASNAGIHGKETHSLLLVITIGILIVGTILAGMGSSLVYLGSHGDTSIRFFGQSLNTSNSGVAAMFIGATLMATVLTKILKRVNW